jgi:hypothetical protein
MLHSLLKRGRVQKLMLLASKIEENEPQSFMPATKSALYHAPTSALAVDSASYICAPPRPLSPNKGNDRLNFNMIYILGRKGTH